MNDGKVTVITTCFLTLCLALAGCVYFLDGQLRTLKAQYDALEQRRANLAQDRDSLMEQITVFENAFSFLEVYNVRAASSDMDFYSQVQRQIDPYIRNGAVVITTSRQNGVSDGRSSISLTLRGEYYSFMKILAAWRNLHTTVRVSQLSVAGSENPQTPGEIQADIVLEAIVSAMTGQAGQD